MKLSILPFPITTSVESKPVTDSSNETAMVIVVSLVGEVSDDVIDAVGEVVS